MKFNNYFNNLARYWSANFLALLSSTFLLSFITWLFVTLVELGFKATSFSEYIKLADLTCPLYSPVYSIIFSRYLATF